ncbi:hypothetical protein MSG28_008763 [Choristoneura fumiferana]|uniref:Uncharacterized protein n=1 Tax=Choristoneura fumiferana TaxID=7141 RepID=A0ACC0J7X5_CHOFU|nr:hypothetical protein MSG28_008763 [Choristoneura fumiferana]
MVVFKIWILLAAVHVVQPKPLLFKEINVKKNFEFSLKPLLKPVTFIKEWKPFGPIKVEHKIAKRSPYPGADGPPLNVQPSPAPLFKIDLEKSLELHSAVSTLPPHKEANLNKQPPPSVGLSPVHEKIHEEHFDHITKSAAGKQLARFDLGPASVSPPEFHRRNMPPHVGLPPVSPVPPPHVNHEDHLRESRLFGESPPLGPHIPQVTVGYEQHLLVEPKPKVTTRPVIADEGTLHGFSKPPSVIIQGHPPPPPPPHLYKIGPTAPGNENEGTLDSFFGPPTVERLEKPVHFPLGSPHHTPDLNNGATGPGSVSVVARPQLGIEEEREPPHHMPLSPEISPPPPAGIQENPHRQAPVLPPKPTAPENNRGSLFTDISRVDEISAYIKAIDALPVVKPPLEEIVPGNSLEPVGPKLNVDAKAEPTTFAKGSRLALYFGNILLQMMSQAIGSARSAIGQYSMPSMI